MRTLALLIISFIYLSFGASAQLIKHSYRFYNNFSVAPPECGPDLTQPKALGNCAAAAPTPGSFITDTLPYCGLKKTVYHNNLDWGLMYPNTSGTVTNTYTIHLYVKTTVWGPTWTRIIDFSNGNADAGIYFRTNGVDRCLNFYPNGNVGTCPYFNNTTYYLLTFTRNGATGIIDVYVNNTLFTSYNDASNTYVGTAGTPIYIYRDDRAVSCESGEANFAYLSFTNQYSSQATVNQVYSDICSIVNINKSTDFSLTPNITCDSTQNITATYTGDIPPPGNGYTFNWNWDGGTVLSGTGMGPYTVKWNSSGTKNITLSVTNNTCGNVNDTTKQLFIKSKLSSTVTQSICNGQTYLGHNSSGTYIDTFVSVNGCDSIRTLNLTVTPPLTSTINKSICAGQTFLGHSTAGTYIDTLVSSGGCDSILTLNLSVTPPVFSAISQAICQGQTYLGYSTAGTYIDTLISSSGCDSIRTLNLSVTPPVLFTVNHSICPGQSYLGHNTSGAYIDTLVAVSGCDSIRTLNLTVTQTIIQNVSASICDGSTYQLPGGKTVSVAGTYNDTLPAKSGCDSVVITTLSLSPPLSYNASNTDVSCYGNHDGTLQLSASNGALPYSFQVTGAGTNTNGIFDNLSAGIYSFVITDSQGCSVAGTDTISQPDKIIITVRPADTTVNSKDVIPITASCNYQDASFDWNPATFLSCNTCPETVSTPTENITYHLTVSAIINNKTCSADTSIAIFIKAPTLLFPTAFSPNGDGINDYFQLVGNALKYIDNITVQVFNRWGQQVFKSSDINFKWDGKFQNEPLPIGVYSYIIKYKLKDSNQEESIIKGNMTLLR